ISTPLCPRRGLNRSPHVDRFPDSPTAAPINQSILDRNMLWCRSLLNVHCAKGNSYLVPLAGRSWPIGPRHRRSENGSRQVWNGRIEESLE
ncbi:unnamed protein product, partial [Linum tenue]